MKCFQIFFEELSNTLINLIIVFFFKRTNRRKNLSIIYASVKRMYKIETFRDFKVKNVTFQRRRKILNTVTALKKGVHYSETMLMHGYKICH